MHSKEKNLLVSYDNCLGMLKYLDQQGFKMVPKHRGRSFLKPILKIYFFIHTCIGLLLSLMRRALLYSIHRRKRIEWEEGEEKVSIFLSANRFYLPPSYSALGMTTSCVSFPWFPCSHFACLAINSQRLSLFNFFRFSDLHSEIAHAAFGSQRVFLHFTSSSLLLSAVAIILFFFGKSTLICCEIGDN